MGWSEGYSLKVKPKVRLSDKNDWYLLIRLKHKSSKKALSPLSGNFIIV